MFPLYTVAMVIVDKFEKHFVAKEPMSITAVGIYDIANQKFETSHFWEKLEHMLIVYYHYLSKHTVKAYDYRVFPIIGYEFHEFDDIEIEALRQDWENVRALVERVVLHHPGPRTKEWKEVVKQEYIEVHGELRRVLSYIDLAPKFPPRFRLKKTIVSNMIAKHFGYSLEQLPGKYVAISDIDIKCHELTTKYKNHTVGELADRFGIPKLTVKDSENKAISEQITVAMFGGTSKKLNQIELFEKFGLIGKTIVMTALGGRTEDMKLFHIDFEEIMRTEVIEDGKMRNIQFEDSDLYAYFADHEFLCIIYEEPKLEIESKDEKTLFNVHKPLIKNRFIGFKRLVFSDKFIGTIVKKLWEDIREKVMKHTLEDIVQYKKDGTVVRLKNGEISSAPNFLKSKDNAVFVRGSGVDSSLKNKTEYVNGIHMLPQYVWIKGSAVVEELRKLPLL